MSWPTAYVCLGPNGEPHPLAVVRRLPGGALAAVAEPKALWDSRLAGRTGVDAEPPELSVLGATGTSPRATEPARHGLPRLSALLGRPRGQGYIDLFDWIAHGDILPAPGPVPRERPVDVVVLGPGQERLGAELEGTPWRAPGGGQYRPRVRAHRDGRPTLWVDPEGSEAFALGPPAKGAQALAQWVGFGLGRGPWIELTDWLGWKDQPEHIDLARAGVRAALRGDTECPTAIGNGELRVQLARGDAQVALELTWIPAGADPTSRRFEGAHFPPGIWDLPLDGWEVWVFEERGDGPCSLRQRLSAQAYLRTAAIQALAAEGQRQVEPA